MLYIQFIRLLGIFIAIIMVWRTGIREIQQILKSIQNEESGLPEKEAPSTMSYSYFTVPQNLCQPDTLSPPQNLTQTINQQMKFKRDEIRFQMVQTQLDQMGLDYKILYADNKPVEIICYGRPKETGRLRSEVLKS